MRRLRRRWVILLLAGAALAAAAGIFVFRPGRGGRNRNPPSQASFVFPEIVLAGKSRPFPADFSFPLVMTGGCALVDADRDGRLDVVAAVPLAKGSRLTLWRQESRWMFRQASIADVPEVVNGIAAGDLNHDGHTDLFVTSHGPSRLYAGDGTGRFADRTSAAGIADRGWGMSAAFFDYDRDGWLDIYVTHYVQYSAADRCADASGAPDFCNPKVLKPLPHVLYRNTGDPQLRFENRSAESGIAAQPGPGLGVVAADFTQDGWADVYVANDGAANFLWVNQRNGTFLDEAVPLGCATDLQGNPQASMGLAIGDLDGNGRWDLVSTHLVDENHALYLGMPHGFEESSGRWGLAQASIPDTGFGTAFLDVDLDGDLDLVVVNGKVLADGPASTFTWNTYAQRNQLFVNDHGRQFLPAGAEAGAFGSTPRVSRALACGDLDDDGDVDLAVATAEGELLLYRNEAERHGHWLSVRAVGSSGGDVLGTAVTLKAHGRRWRGLVCPHASYLSTHDARVHFGLGACDRVDSIEVEWPDGTREQFPGTPVDGRVEVRKGSGVREQAPRGP